MRVRGVGRIGAAAQGRGTGRKTGRGGACEEIVARFSDSRPRPRVGGNRSSPCIPDSQVSSFPDKREIIKTFGWNSRLLSPISGLLVKTNRIVVVYWGNCVSALTFNPNCDFTLIFVDFTVLPLLFTNEAAVCPYF